LSVKLILNGQLDADVDKEQLNQLADFSFNAFSPNPEPIQSQLVEFTCTGNNPLEFIRNWIDNNGIYQNIPAVYKDTRTGDLLLNGYLDLASLSNEYFERFGVYNIELKPNNESFFDVAKGLELRELQDNLDIDEVFRITKSDYERIKYVISTVPDVAQALVLTLALFQIGYNLANGALDLGKVLADIAAIFTAPAGAIKSILVLAFYVAQIAAIYSLLKQISNLIFSKIKEYWCINIKNLLEKACSYLGYTLQTSLFDGDYSKLSLLASTGESGVTRGNPVNNPIPNKLTLLDLFERVGKLFNAKLQPKSDRTVVFENKEFFLNGESVTTLPAMFEDPAIKPNLKENYRSINLQFRKDSVEKNTYLGPELLGINLVRNGVNSKGDKLSASYTISGQQDQALSGLNEKLDIDFDFSRAYQKTEETTIERLFNSIYDVVNSFVGLFNKSSQSDKIGSRKGFMILDNDFVGIDKIFILGNNGKLSNDNFRLVHCETLFNNYYQIETIKENQYKIVREISPVPICDPEVIFKLKDNNIVTTSDGRAGILTLNERNLETGYHQFEYRVKLQTGDRFYISPDLINENIVVE